MDLKLNSHSIILGEENGPRPLHIKAVFKDV